MQDKDLAPSNSRVYQMGKQNMRVFSRYQIVDKFQSMLDNPNSGLNDIEVAYYETIIKYLWIEELFQDEVDQAGKRIYYHFKYNPPEVYHEYFTFLYDRYNPVRFAVETFDSIESIRIYIKENKQ